jgi:hypothetical protein
MPPQQTRPPVARPVNAIVVRRFRLAIIDETGRPVIGICEVPEHLVNKTADFLNGIVPAIQGLATVQGQVSALFAQFSSTFGGGSSSTTSKPRRRRR